MKKTLLFLIISALCLPLFTGCFASPADKSGTSSQAEQTKIPSEGINTEYEGVYLTLESLTDTGITVIWHNETDKEITYGEWYSIEIMREGEWVSVLSEEMIVPSIAILLMPHGEMKKTYSTSFFDLSENGLYRLRCEFYPGSGTCNTWVEFEVTDKEAIDELWVSPAHSGNIVAECPSEKITALLNKGEWVNDVTDCAHDYVFTLNGKKIRYHSSCGTFIDIESTRSLTVAESDKEEINTLLKSLLGDWDDSWE